MQKLELAEKEKDILMNLLLEEINKFEEYSIVAHKTGTIDNLHKYQNSLLIIHKKLNESKLD